MKSVGYKDKTYFYSNPVILGCDFIFAQDIDCNKLDKAFKKAIKKHSYLAVRPVIKGNAVYYEKNISPMPLIDKDKLNDVHLGTDETNGFLFVFSLSSNILTFLIAHALTDYHALTIFLDSLIGYLGLEYKIKEGRDFIAEIDKTNKLDCFNPYKLYAKKDYKNTQRFDLNDNFIQIPVINKEKCNSFSFNITTSEYVEYFKKYNTSFVPMLADIVSCAIQSVNKEGVPLGMINADARKTFNSNCLTNFSEGVLLKHTKSFCDQDIERRTSLIKNSIKEQLTPEFLNDLMLKRIKDVKDFEKLKCKKSNRVIPTYSISYLGKDHYTSSLGGFIKEYNPYPILPFSPLLFIEVVARDDFIELQFYLSGDCLCYTKLLVEEFERRGISTTAIKSISTTNAYLDLNYFKRI